MIACTIIAKNYVAHARVLARSFLDHHPDGRFYTLVIDEPDGYIDPSQEPFELVRASEIGCAEFDEMAVRYGLLELSTAVKPWLLRHLMALTGEPITYLDPDIRVYASLEALDHRAREHGLALTPHSLAPLPDDGRRPAQTDITVAGVFNLGYISVAPLPPVERFLDWWASRLVHDCRVAPEQGIYVDQRWLDLAPAFLADLAIVREPGYNVAYWNLPGRQFTHEADGGYRVDGEPLAFFHFSAFDPEQPTELSNYQNRIRLADHPALRRICREYAEAAIAAGYRTSRRWPYTYGTLPGDVPFDATLRELVEVARGAGGPEESPLTAAGGEAFVTWAGGQQDGAPPGISRLLAHVYGNRPELRARFPDPHRDRDDILAWALGEGTEEIPSLRRLGVAAGFQAPVAPDAADGPWGVNVVGYFRSELGVGESARGLVAALDAADVPALPVHGATVPESRQGHPYDCLAPDDAIYPVNLIVMNADRLPEFAGQVGRPFFAGRYSVGWWAWEASRFREEWAPSFRYVDEVWTPSTYVSEALSAIATVPLRTIGNPVLRPAVAPSSRAALGVPDGFFFLFSYDMRSIAARKNPFGVLEAFRRAFPEPAPGGPQLVVKSINGDFDAATCVRLGEEAAARPDVTVIDRYLDPGENAALTMACDCYVSLHRAEGFGYTMAEAMACGKPVIATGYSGNLDFMNEHNSLLVRHRLVPVGPGADPYPPDGEWAEPDLDHAAELMRRIYADGALRGRIGARAEHDIVATHSPEAIGRVLARRLEQIRSNRRYWRQWHPAPPAPASPERGPVAPSPQATLRRFALAATRRLEHAIAETAGTRDGGRDEDGRDEDRVARAYATALTLAARRRDAGRPRDAGRSDAGR